MTRRLAPASAGLLALALALALANPAAAAAGIFIGSGAAAAGGTSFVASTPDSGERMNVARRTDGGVSTMTLPAGTYDVASFAVDASTATGTITPFLATLTDDATRTYQTLYVGPARAVAAAGVGLSTYPAGSERFTLASPAVVFAGVYTAGGARVDYVAGGSADHDGGTFGQPGGTQGPTAAGQGIGPFTNPDLGRTYAFQLVVVPVPEPDTLAALGVGMLALVRRRR